MTVPSRIVLTCGEPAGIGPDLIVRLAQRQHTAELIAVCAPELLAARARLLDLPLRLEPFDETVPASAGKPGALSFTPIEIPAQARCGHLDTANVNFVLEALRVAAGLCLDGIADAVITGPIHKGVINDAGIAFTGHTEFLADFAGSAQPVMMLATAGLRVALATTHMPLRAVADAITEPRLLAILQVLAQDLKRWYGLERSRIQVCGLNPHAGETGHLGTEELTIIEPAIAAARRLGLDVVGPVPADTAFLPQRLRDVDVTVAMYHDQGLPVLKQKGFGEAVNVTLGLPFIRTSVDHGTALEIAGTDGAELGSMLAALAQAEAMIEVARISHQGTR